MSSVGLDVGGSYIKGARLNRDGSTGSVIRRLVPAFLDTTSAAREIDAGELIAEVAAVLESLEDDGPITRILVTGQMAGIAFVDPEGAAVAPLVSWQDVRGSNAEDIAAALGTEAVSNLGEALRPGLPLVTLASTGVPAGAHVTSLIGFVAGALAGCRAPVVHVTDAAAWGIYDLRHERWSDAALTLLGIQASDLPRVSWTLEEVGARAGVPVLCAMGDQQASLLGAGLVEDSDRDSVSVNLATGCQVSITSPHFDAPAQVRPMPAPDGSRRYLHTVTHLPAGRILTAAVAGCRGATEDEDWAWAAQHVDEDARLESAVEQIVDGVVAAVARLGASGKGVLFSGGLVQQFEPVRARILARLNVGGRVFPGDDAALTGLSQWAKRAFND